MAIINSIKNGNNIYPFSLPYGVCSTAADTVAKTVTVENFSLETGATVIVKFTYANSASTPTLNVNNTGAKPIYRYGTTATSTGTTTTGWVAGAVQMFTYDGAGWIRDYWNNTTYSNASLGQGYVTCSTAEATTAKVATLSSYALTAGGIVSVKFTYAVPASATLNISSKGAKSIYYNGSAIKAGVIKAGDIATFIYSSQYHLIGIDRAGNSGTGITVNGFTINHSNSITAGNVGSAQSPSHGGTFAIPKITYDAQGHITKAETVNITLPTYTFNGAISNVKDNNLLENSALVSDGNGKIAISTTTSTELGYLSGATSNIQTQLNGKVAKSNTGVQCISGGLVIGASSSTGLSGTGLGRIMFTGQTNPLIGVQAVDSSGTKKTPYFIQSVASDDCLYIGPTSTKALKFDTNGNMTSSATLTVGGLSAPSATQSVAGLMSAADKTKLDGIAAQANKYSLPTASSSTLGGVKIGSNITVSSGTISLTKANVTTALGYTPPTSDNNTTYTFASGDSNGQIKVTPSGGSAQNVSVTGLAAAAYKAVTDSTSASAISTGTSLVTERDVYYGLPKINNSNSYTRSTTIYAPTSAGTSGYILKSAGSGNAPTWLQTLPVANGGTGATTAQGAVDNLIAGTSIQPLAIEFPGMPSPPSGVTINGGYIDFHYPGGNTDFTSRFIEYSDGLYVERDGNTATKEKIASEGPWKSITLNSGITEATSGGSRPLAYRKVGNHVYITGSISFTASSSAITVFTIPSGYRPKQGAVLWAVASSNFARIQMYSNGQLKVDAVYNQAGTKLTSGSVSWCSIQMDYFID